MPSGSRRGAGSPPRTRASLKARKARRRVKGRGRFRVSRGAAWRLAKTRRTDARRRRGRADVLETFTFGMCERVRDETSARASRTFDAFLQLPHGFGGGALKRKRRAAGFALLPLEPGEVRVHLRLQRVGERADVDDDGVGGHGFRGEAQASSARARVRRRFVVRCSTTVEFREFRFSTTRRRNVAARDARAPRSRRPRDVSTFPPMRVFLGRMGFRTLRASFRKRASQGDSNGPTEVAPRGSLGSIRHGGGRTSGMCDAPTDDADAPRVSPGDSQLVHVDCERCRSRLEVRVPRAFQLAGRDATVRCGACETLLQVAVPPSPRSTPAPTSGSQDSRAMHAAAAAFLRHHPVEDDHSGPTTAPSDAEHRAGMPPRSHDEQRRHMQLAQWHMNMAQRPRLHSGRWMSTRSSRTRPRLRRCRRTAAAGRRGTTWTSCCAKRRTTFGAPRAKPPTPPTPLARKSFSAGSGNRASPLRTTCSYARRSRV